MGILVALDQEMPDFADVASTLLDSAMSTAKIGGAAYALALNTNTKILFYNVKMLKDAGIAVPTTMDELVAAVRRSPVQTLTASRCGAGMSRLWQAGTCAPSFGALAARF
jgi:multiple sugar transport system substrate-binding protein